MVSSLSILNAKKTTIMCNATYSINGLEVTVDNFDAPIVAIKILYPDYNTVASCDQWTTPCNEPEIFTLPAEGSYFIQIQTFQDWSTPLCNIFETINAVADPCAATGDTDGDGVCDDVDCDINDPLISFEGDVCDDGDSTTVGDIILADCSCAGTVPPNCDNNGGDVDGDGVCADVDCDDTNPLISFEGDICDDGDSTTVGDIILADCSCAGIAPPTCDNNGGDVDGDGICADVDCDDNDPLVSNTGDACDDNDPLTENDVIQTDCSCAGTPLPPSGCQTTYSVSGLEITISPINANINSVKVLRQDYSTVFSCDQWTTVCANTETITLPQAGTYFVQIQTYEDWSTPLCDIFETINAVADPCAGIGDTDGDGVCDDVDCDINDPLISSMGDLCDDGDSTTVNDIILADCSCAGTVPPNCDNDGGDADNDGVCADFDCDDNDPLISNAGDACDDGDVDTENDIIQADCSCAGTPVNPNACNVTYSVNNNVITVNNVIGTFTSVKILDSNYGTDYTCDNWTTPCDTNLVITLTGFGDYFIQVQTYADWTTIICDILDPIVLTDPNMSDPCDFNGGDADGDGFCADIDCDDNDPAIRQAGDVCDDGDSMTTNDLIQADCSCAGTIPNACLLNGGDADGDGICGDIDCNDNDTSIGAPGSPCDDGDANTENDELQADCSCIGTPVVDSSNCNVSFTIIGNVVSIYGVTAPIHNIQILDSNFGLDYACNSWSTACEDTIIRPVSGTGTYFIQIQTYADWSSPAICDIFETVIISDVDPCLDNGGDVDGDGVCADVDCDDNNANISSPGDACNDGDPLTENDVIQADCSCAGTLCDNVIDGGQISGDELICQGDTLAAILSDSLPAGGTGAMQYLWLSSTTGCPMSLSEAITGADQSTYMPEPVTETTYFKRLSRRDGCADWFAGESNCVMKTIDPTCPTSSLCNAQYVVGADEVVVSGLNYPITSVQVLDAGTFTPIYTCNDWTTACGATVTVPLSTGDYYVAIQTFETWTDQRCDIFDLITVTGNSPRQSNGNIDQTRAKATIPVFQKENIVLRDVLVFPNPANEVIHISSSEFSERNIEIQLFDQLGKRLKYISRKGENGNLITIPTDNLDNGVYTILISSEQGQRISKRFLISK